MKNRKQQLIAHVLDLMSPDSRPDADQALQLWFMNIRESGGMRLTRSGFDALTELNFEHWPIVVDDVKTRLKLPQLLGLDRKMQNPYYIDYRKRRLIFFGSRDAMMLTLCGDVNGFLRTL